MFLRIQIALKIVIFLYQTILFEEYGNKNVYMFLTAYFQVLLKIKILSILGNYTVSEVEYDIYTYIKNKCFFFS